MGYVQQLNVVHSYDTRRNLKSTKTAADRRSPPLTDDAVDALKAHRAAQTSHVVGTGRRDPIIVTETGTRAHPDMLEKWWHRDRAGLGAQDYCLHELRRSYLTALASVGVHPKVMQALTGQDMPHSSAAASSWQFQHIMDTKRTHVGKSAFARSNTVPVSEPYLRPHALQSHLCDPVADRPPAPVAARAPGAWPEGLGRLLEGAPAVRLAAGPCLDRCRQQRKVVGAERGDARGVGVRPHIRFPSARADVPRDVTKHRGGRPHGQIYVGGNNPITGPRDGTQLRETITRLVYW